MPQHAEMNPAAKRYYDKLQKNVLRVEWLYDCAAAGARVRLRPRYFLHVAAANRVAVLDKATKEELSAEV